MEICTQNVTPGSARRLEELLGRGGESVEVGGNRPLLLDASNQAWLMVAGRVDVFSVLLEGERRGARVHLATCRPGEVVFGAACEARPTSRGTDGWDPRSGLIGIPHPGTRLIRWQPEALAEPRLSPQDRRLLVAALDGWVEGLLQRLAWSECPPDAVAIEPESEIVADAEQLTASPRRSPVWIRCPNGGWRLFDQAALVLPANASPLPVSCGTWVTATAGSGPLVAGSTAKVLSEGQPWDGLGQLYRLLRLAVELRARSESEAEELRSRRRQAAELRALKGVHRKLAAVLAPPPDKPGTALAAEVSDPLLAVCELVLERQGVAVRLRADAGRTGSNRRQRLRWICDANRMRHRRVRLRHGWRRQGGGPLVGFLGSLDRGTARPVALLPVGLRRYDVVDPETGSRAAVDEEQAAKLVSEAYELHPPQPAGPPTVASLLRMALQGGGRDLWTIGALTLCAGLLALLIPIIVAVVYGRVIPGGQRSELLPLMLALIAAALGAAAFQITRSLSTLRITSRVDGVVQMTVFDRLLRLPASFFRRFSVGDLTDRALGVDMIRELLPADVTNALLALVVSTVSIGLLFYLSWKLALLAMVLVTVLAAVAAVFGHLQLRYQRILLQVQGRISSLVYNLIHGIAKLRTSGTERRAYCQWAQLFVEQRQRTFEAQSVAQLQTVLTGTYALVSQLALFALMGFGLKDQLQVASFLAFSAAFGQVQAAALTIVLLLPELLSIAPAYERLRPILEAEPEVDADRPPVGELRGDLELRHVSFRYQPDSSLVLEDVSIEVREGELVAIVGPSGSGKSTLLRLLLGFEHAETGSVLYDGKNLTSLDLGSVRSQIGVVLQNSCPIAGDIYSNIIGSSNLGVEAAWEAARMAGLEDDIRALPMGMHTIVGEGATTFSGGQRQRLMIARALVHHPRIVFLDEATSALDNPTQEVIRKNLDRLQATRVIIAHRLSTIRHADRIYVLHQGRIVDQGPYQELIERGGLFSQLAERQTTAQLEPSGDRSGYVGPASTASREASSAGALG